MQLKFKITASGSSIFTTTLKTRVNDLNYGNHVGHQMVYEYCHDARLEFLSALSNEIKDVEVGELSELNFGKHGLILSQSAASYHNEIFHPQELKIDIYLDELKKHSFQLIYQIHDKNTDSLLTKVLTTMICYDYEKQKISEMNNSIYEHLDKKIGL